MLAAGCSHRGRCAVIEGGVLLQREVCLLLVALIEGGRCAVIEGGVLAASVVIEGGRCALIEGGVLAAGVVIEGRVLS